MKLSLRLQLFVLSILTLPLSGCLDFTHYKHSPDSASPNQHSPTGEMQDPLPIRFEASYRSLQDSLFGKSCVKCHTGPRAPHGVDLSSYNKIMSNEMFPPLVIPGDPEHSSLYEACASGIMPKGSPPLSSDALQALYLWIKNGATEDGSIVNTQQPPQPSEPGSDGGVAGEPCDSGSAHGEPGVSNCTNEPPDD